MKPFTPTEILQQIAQIQRMEPGKLCIIRQGPNGPYYNLQCREQGQTFTRYVPPDQVEVLSQHTANFQKFQELVGQYAQLIIQQTRAERSAGLKKRPRAPNPPGPGPGNPTVNHALPCGPTQRSGGLAKRRDCAYTGGLNRPTPSCVGVCRYRLL